MEIKGHDLERTWLCSVLFTDIANYSAQPVQQQIEWKKRFNHFLTEALAEHDPEERYVLDTGDGAAVCFMGAPEPAMQAALKLLEFFIHDDRAHAEGLAVRIGINLGPLRLMKDLNGHVNAVGEAINVGQRVMSFAKLNEILVSRSFYETVSCLSEANARLFSPLGVRKDKHEREHVIYHLDPEGFENVAAVVAEIPVAAKVREERLFEEATLRKISTFLAPIIGPIANRLIHDESMLARDLTDLANRLSAHLPDDRSRERFLQQWKVQIGATANAEKPAVVKSATQKSGSFSGNAGFIDRTTQELARYIGPMARIIVANAAKVHSSTEDLLSAISLEIPSTKDRDAFRKAVNKRN